MTERLGFGAAVSAWVKKTKERQLLVFREASQRVFEEAQTPRIEGGPMSVDTGFLRASFISVLGEAPFAVTYNPAPSRSPSERGNVIFPYSGAPLALTISNATITDQISGVWTANYAPFVEAKTGFVRLPVQRWQTIVRETCEEAKKRIP